MVEIDLETQDRRIAYEDVKEFLDGLNQSGFRISLQQYTSANRLLLGLISHESILRNPRSLRTYLAPVICSTPAEQEDFYRLFDIWLRRIRPAAVIDADEVDSTLSSRSTTQIAPNPVLLKHKLIDIAVPVLLLVIVAVVIYYVRREAAPRTLTVRVVQANTFAPIPDAEVSFAGIDGVTDGSGVYRFTYRLRNATPTVRASSRGVSETFPVTKDNQSVELALNLDSASTPTPSPLQTPIPISEINDPHVYAQQQIPATNQWSTTDVYLRYFVLILVGVVALPFFIYLIWRIWRMLRRRQLERWRTREQPETFNLAVKGVANHLYRNPAFRTFAQELRRHRRLKSNTLDASASVDATSNAGGLFTPVFECHQLTPEYLILIDAQSFQDQKAHLDEEIIKRLRKEGVYVDQYYFNGDPRVCQTRQPQIGYRTLGQIATRHPEHRLVVFSNGAGFIDPLSCRPYSWVEQFSHWPVRALITAEPTWGYREWALEQTGLTVIPAAEEGLIALGKLTRNFDIPPRTQISQSEDFYPARLLENPKRWTARRSPSAEEIVELGYELRFYLGNEGFYLLCACAVYPALIWDLTLYFSAHLIGPKNLESTLAALVRLPWFRTGEMPDWLRSHLISRLPPPREKAVRKLLQRLLVSYVENPKQGFDLEIVREPAPESSTWRERLDRAWQRLREWKRRKFLQDVIRTAPDDSLFREYVFLNFMSRSKLAVLLPWRLRRLLYSQGQPILGLHPVRALVLPLVVAIVGGLSVVAMGAGLTSDGGFGPISFPTLSPMPTPAPSPIDFDPQVYKVRAAFNLPAGIPELRGQYYSDAVRVADSAFQARYGAQARLGVTTRIIIDPTECLRDVGTTKCVDVFFNFANLPPGTGGFEIVDADTGGALLAAPGARNYRLRVNNLDLNARTLTITVRSEDDPTSVRNTTLVIARGQAFTTFTIQLWPGTSVLVVTDGKQNFQERFLYLETPGVIHVNYIDEADGRTLEGAFTFQRSSTPFPLTRRLVTGEVSVHPGIYQILGSVDGYESKAADVTVVEGQIATVDLRLRRILPSPSPSVSPPPSPSPSPPPPVTIVAVDLTFTILLNDKDDGSVIKADIALDGRSRATGSYGEGVTWKAKTKNDFTLALSTPVLASDCKRLVFGLRNERMERGEDTWLMQVIATLKLSDGSSIRRVLEEIRLRKDRPLSTSFDCPATPAGPGMF